MAITHKHHIIPKHLGGTDDPSNLVELSIEEHAEAHKKLFELYGRWQDEIAWKGLAGLISRAEIVKAVQSAASKEAMLRIGNPWKDRRTSANWAENKDLQKKASLAAVSPMANFRRKATMAENNHQKGSKNSRFGKSLYVNKDGTRKYFIRNEEPEGWILRSIHVQSCKDKSAPTYGRSWYNDGKKNFFLKRDDPLIEENNLEKRRITA